MRYEKKVSASLPPSDRLVRVCTAPDKGKKHSPEPAHADLVSPCILRVEGVEVVLHDQAEVPEVKGLLPCEVAAYGTTSDAQERDKVHDPVREGGHPVLLCQPGRLNGTCQHGGPH